jgi:transposase-like protein
VYGQGLSVKAIQENLKDVYNADVSPELISRVTDEVKGLAEEWQTRPFEPVYPVIFLMRYA